MSETTAVTSDGETVEYRDIPGCPGYRVGNDGSLWTAVVRDVVLVGGGLPGLRGSRVRVGDEWRKMRTRPNKKGYLTVIVRVGGRKRTLNVHRTVLLAFVGPCPDGMECCHIDGDPHNNDIDNLRWDTASSNTLDSVRHGTHPAASKTHCKRGHEFTPENTIAQHHGGRRCRTCRAQSERSRTRAA